MQRKGKMVSGRRTHLMKTGSEEGICDDGEVERIETGSEAERADVQHSKGRTQLPKLGFYPHICGNHETFLKGCVCHSLISGTKYPTRTT